MERKSKALQVLEDNELAILAMHDRDVNPTAIGKIYGVSAPTVRAFIERKTGENETETGDNTVNMLI